MSDDEELTERIVDALLPAVTEWASVPAGGQIFPVEVDALHEMLRDTVSLTIAQHRAPLGR